MQIRTMSNYGGYLTPQQIELLFHSCKNKRDKVFIWTLYDSGRRVSEWLAIRWKDIKWDLRLVVTPIIKKKFPTRREIPLGNNSMEMLRKYKELLENDEIRIHKKVDTVNGRVFPITRQYAGKIIKMAAIRAGITDVGDKHKAPHPHMLRHSRAIAFVKAGMDKMDLQKFMVHSKLDTTADYVQYTGADLRRLRDKYTGMD